MKIRAILMTVFASFPSLSMADGTWNQTTPPNKQQWWNQQPSLPPLNSPLVWGRKTTNEIANGSGNVLSLIFEQTATAYPVWPWPLYIELDTAHNSGDGVGAYSRLYSRGSGWSAAYHAESIAYGQNATTILYNGEMSPMAGSTGSYIGVNLQAKNGYGTSANIFSNVALQIQSDPGVGWHNGIRFDGVTASHGIEFSPASSGSHAIYVMGNYPVAMTIKDGEKVCFEQSDSICMRFNPGNRHLEFLTSLDRVLGYFNVDNPINKCLNC